MATYRLLKTVSGVTHFAEVSCRQTRNSQHHVSLAQEIMVSREKSFIEWTESAVDGVLQALAYHGSNEHSIEITEIRGTIIDTKQDTVLVAAFLATLRCLGVDEKDLPKPCFNEGWKIY